jgi:hypothetical protein
MILLAAKPTEEKEHWSLLLRHAVRRCRRMQTDQHRRYKEAHLQKQQAQRSQSQPSLQQQPNHTQNTGSTHSNDET